MIHSRRALGFACVVAAVLAMGSSLRNGFAYDDLPAIVHNIRVTDPANWHTIPNSAYWLGTLWRPLTTALFAIQWWISGGSPLLFHVVSVAAYAALVYAVFILMQRCGLPRVAAAVAAIWFAVHPVHVEVVANAVGQSELWMALATAWCMILLLDDGPMTPTRHAGVLVLAAAAAMAKEQGFMLPLIAVGAEWLRVRTNEKSRWRVGLLLQLALVSALLFAWRAHVLGGLAGEHAAIPLRNATIGVRLASLLAATAEYARLLVWPWHLQADYSPPGFPVGGPIGVEQLIGAVLLLAAVAIALAASNRPVLRFGAWWCAAALLPVANLLVPTGMLMSERALFLPSIGVACVAGSVTDVVSHWVLRYRAIATALLAAWILAAAIRSETRTVVWRDQPTFFAAMVLDAPRSYRAWKVGGEYRSAIGDHAQAITHFEQANALWPHDPETDVDLGQEWRVQQRYDLAAETFSHGLALDSSNVTLRARLVECLIALKRWPDARRVANEGLALGEDGMKLELDRIDKAALAAQR